MYKEGTGELIDKLSVNSLKILVLEGLEESSEQKDKLKKAVDRQLDLEDVLVTKLEKVNMGTYLDHLFRLHTSNHKIFQCEDALQIESHKEGIDFNLMAKIHKTRLQEVNRRRSLINLLNKLIDGLEPNEVRIHKPIK